MGYVTEKSMSNRKSNQLSCWQPSAANTHWLVAIKEEVMNNLARQNLWSDNQFVFRKNKSSSATSTSSKRDGRLD